jgi:hypothetical protein
MSAQEIRTLRRENRTLQKRVLDLEVERTTRQTELTEAQVTITRLEQQGADVMLRTERDNAVAQLVTVRSELNSSKTTATGHLLALEAALAERDELQEDHDALAEDLLKKVEYIKEIKASHEELVTKSLTVAELNRQLEAKAQEVLRLNEALAQQVASTTPSSKTSLKFKAPEMFDGTGDYRDWMRKLRLFLRYSKVDKDEEMIEVALSYLSGNAAKVMEAYFQWAEDKEDMGPFTEFEETLNSTYDNKDRVAEARHKMGLLSQNSTMSQYAADFKTLAAMTGFSQADLMYRYEYNMHGKYKTLLRRSLIKPSTLEELITWSLKTAQVETQAQEIEEARTPRQPKEKQTERQGGWRQKKAQEASTSPTQVTTVKPTPGETRDCFNCDEKGHLAVHCPKPKRQRKDTPRIQATGTTTMSMQEQMEELRAQVKDMSQMFNHAIGKIPKPQPISTMPSREKDF